MDIRYRLYPYPVLSETLDDYKKNCIFNVDIQLVKDASGIRIDISAILTSKDLAEMIKNGEAAYVYHVECPQTSFRHAYMTDKPSLSIPVSSKNVRGKYQICSVIVAKKDLVNWQSEDFNEDFDGMKFDIDAGSILAVGPKAFGVVEADVDDLAKIPSMFCIMPNKKIKEMQVDEYDPKISIILPYDDYALFEQLNETPRLQPILYSMTIIPALIHTFELIKSIAREDPGKLEDLAEYSWYRSLKKNVLKKLNIDFDDSTQIENLNSVTAAQQLLEFPISAALHEMSNSDNGGGTV